VTLLYALGVGTLAYVAVALLGLLLRLASVRLDLTSESVIVGVAAAALVAARGADARRDLSRLAVVGLAAHAALVISRFLGIAFLGRASDGSVDAFLFTPRAVAVLLIGLALGIAVGLIVRGFVRFRLPWQPPERLMRAAGFAFVAGTVASIVWPAPFVGQLLGDTTVVTALVLLPWLLAGPVAGGVHAARAGVDYRGVVLLGAYITLPFLVALVLGTIADVGRLNDPRFDPIAGQIRGAIAVSWFLVAVRLAGWPLGAAFAQGFLAPEESPARREPAP
jgi:hypothetical protein